MTRQEGSAGRYPADRTARKKPLAEAEPCADSIDARAQDLGGEVAVVHRRAVVGDHSLPLENVRLVEGVEHVDAEGEAELAEGELLLHPEVDDVDVGEAEGVGIRVDRYVDARAAVVGDGRPVDAVDVAFR